MDNCATVPMMLLLALRIAAANCSQILSCLAWFWAWRMDAKVPSGVGMILSQKKGVKELEVEYASSCGVSLVLDTSEELDESKEKRSMADVLMNFFWFLLVDDFGVGTLMDMDTGEVDIEDGLDFFVEED